MISTIETAWLKCQEYKTKTRNAALMHQKRIHKEDKRLWIYRLVSAKSERRMIAEAVARSFPDVDFPPARHRLDPLSNRQLFFGEFQDEEEEEEPQEE